MENVINSPFANLLFQRDNSILAFRIIGRRILFVFLQKKYSLRSLIIILSLLLLSVSAKAAKSDTVTLYNGDRITCDVKDLSQGKLYVNTDDMGKIYIQWIKVAHIDAKNKYEITLSDHSKIYGTLSSTDEKGKVVVRFGVFQETVSLESITSLVKINPSFVQQLSGSFDAGYSFTKGNNNTQFNSSAEVKHRSQKFLNKINYNGVISITTESQSKNQSGGYTLQSFLPNAFFLLGNVSWEQNTELGIDSRILTQGAFGYSPIDNKFNRLDVATGIQLNREFSSEDIATNNAEGILAVNYYLFIFTKPDIQITSGLIFYPSFTVKDRYRSTYNFQMRWKFLSDFTLNFKYYFNYDTKPPSVDALQFDYGINTSIGYSF